MRATDEFRIWTEIVQNPNEFESAKDLARTMLLILDSRYPNEMKKIKIPVSNDSNSAAERTEEDHPLSPLPDCSSDPDL